MTTHPSAAAASDAGAAWRHLPAVAAAYAGLIEQLRRDALTGLPNRLGIGEQLRAAPAAGGTLLALHFFDINFFDQINRIFGHTDAAAALRECARRLGWLAPAEVAP